MLQLNDYILFLYLIIAFVIDVRFHKIPNWLSAGAMLIGILYHLVMGGIDGLIFSFLGLLVAGGIFLLLYVFKALGAGDVKLFAGIGAIVGVQMVLYMMMYSIIVAGIIAIIILLFTKTFLQKMTSALFAFVGSIISKDLRSLEEFKTTKSTRFPFMYAVIPAVIMTYYYVFTTYS
ncbi:prepilin peptidase [Ornithinibacillus sp. BX22]|uniref:Prepilin peptidase n=2 Tax=Ornithinibacillus TaxID=484508 RepID=A0A923RIN5_9BACI|nr:MULTISPECIES: prepilin peptidase [Ornithinibacillus]MBC5637339.1 prepilin peptidase [Ornithinibacillus hominis]MBS3680354.1 prepilin peptidase [Ornithinibacillus massiliensis]